ncbi:E3 ubiquitin/ISG15 ligase TRIM25-like [Mytilus trossulus]|uniref:E3 ubiquitin/ISG15 ligase TRIM25-like n=1 Tax=Mytilus trossulus TaxID=6551 RepID=UPI0030060E2A
MANNEVVSFCDICQSRDINKLAEEYCPQCEEALCEDCLHHHKISKLLKSHQTISFEKYNRLPYFIKKIKLNCEEHDCFFEFYCKSHDSLCCKLCLISGHKECKETIFFEDFLTPSTGYHPVSLHNIEKALKDLETNICSALKDRYRNLTELREQKQKISEQIKEKRQEINTRLDNLEDALLEKTSAMETEYCLQINKVIAKLENEKNKVDDIKEDVDSVKLFASNLQIFMGTKTFQENVSTNEIYVQELYDDGKLNNFTMDCTFNDKLEELRNEIKSFGDIKVENSKKHTSFSWKGDKSAQLSQSISGVKTIENINARLVRKINIDANCLTGCAILEDGNMLFIEAYKNNLLKYASNGEIRSKSTINPQSHSIGYDLAVIDSNTVAVSGGGNPPYRINVIDIS